MCTVNENTYVGQLKRHQEPDILDKVVTSGQKTQSRKKLLLVLIRHDCRQLHPSLPMWSVESSRKSTLQRTYYQHLSAKVEQNQGKMVANLLQTLAIWRNMRTLHRRDFGQRRPLLRFEL